MKHTIIENEPEIKLQNDLNHHIEISPNTKTTNGTTTTTTTLNVNKTLKADLIETSIKNHILTIDHENCLPNDEDSFLYVI